MRKARGATDFKAMRARLRSITLAALNNSPAAGTKQAKASHVRYWRKNAWAMHVNPQTFSTRIDPGWGYLRRPVREDLSTLACLTNYMVFHPRKGGKTHNRVSYASTVV